MSSTEDFGFLKTLEMKKLVWPWRLGILPRNMKREHFCFRSFIFSFLSHRKHRTVKGVEVKLRKHFPSDVHLKILHLPNPFERSHWKSHTAQSISSVTEIKFFWSLRNLFWLRSSEFASADFLHSEEHDSPEDFESQNSDRCCAMRQLSQNIYPPNGHIIEGHLCLIMRAAP